MERGARGLWVRCAVVCLGALVSWQQTHAQDASDQEVSTQDASTQGASVQGASTQDVSLEERVSALEEKVLSDKTFHVFWKDSLRMETADGMFKIRIGGRLQNDWFWGSEDNDVEAVVGKLDDGTEFRRARLYIGGTVYDNMIFKMQYDFADGDADFKDVYAGLTDLPVVDTLLVGQFKEPYGLEQLTSSNQITFMERSLGEALVPGRNSGLMARRLCLEDRMTIAAGLFRQVDSFGDGTGDGDYAGTARVTFLPLVNEEDNQLIHLGLGASYRNIDEIDFESRPEAHLAEKFVDTGTITDVDDVILLGGEAAAVFGPASVQVEYMNARVSVDGSSDGDFSGGYVYASYFLTGEHRPYDKKKGAFKYPKPKRNFRENGGLGAWELAARYSMVDLNDNPINGGKLSDYTAGLNWYLNPNSRVMFNYIRADLDHVGDANLFEIRIQFFF